MDDLPLLDPARDLTTDSGATARPRHAALLRAHATVCRAVDEGITPASARPLPVAPAISVLHPEAEPVLRQRVLTAVECLQRIVRAYPENPALQRFLAVPPVLHRWIVRHRRPESLTVDFCRLDLFGDRLGTVRVLEFNASSPGGVIECGTLARLWRRTPEIGALLDEWRVPAGRFEDEDWFTSWLLAHGRARGLTEEQTRHIGVYRTAGRNPDPHLIAEQFRRGGRTTVTRLPSDYSPGDGARLGYLKHIPADPAPVHGWDRFCAAVTDGDLVIPNVLAQRWVAENKLCLAVLSDPRFEHLFPPADRATLRTIVPWSRKLGDGITVAQAVAERTRLVLKAPYGYFGNSVRLGCEHRPEDWAELVGSPRHRGWLVQERVAPATVGALTRDLCVAVLDHTVLGYFSRVSRSSVVNVAREGAVQTVLSPFPAP
ncbi:hypothetical protein ABTX81_06810 [Kitasatospora sp. NPDC097605]|uniref:hypothetical protein n=1 Tax=Kitasatospora sp. NPDC097605 TaxID=3157226 RepID=UPI003320D7D7